MQVYFHILISRKLFKWEYNSLAICQTHICTCLPTSKKSWSVCQFPVILIPVKHVFSMGTTKRWCPNSAIIIELSFFFNSICYYRTKEMYVNLWNKGLLLHSILRHFNGTWKWKIWLFFTIVQVHPIFLPLYL